MPITMIRDFCAQYDRDHGIMHVTFLPYSSSWDDEEFPGVIIRRAMSDERITGVRIIGYSRKSRDFLAAALPWLDIDALPSDSA